MGQYALPLNSFFLFRLLPYTSRAYNSCLKKNACSNRCTEHAQRSYWWAKVRITTYITLVVLQLILIVYASYWGLPHVGFTGLLWQLIATSSPALLFVYVVLIIVVGVR